MKTNHIQVNASIITQCKHMAVISHEALLIRRTNGEFTTVINAPFDKAKYSDVLYDKKNTVTVPVDMDTVDVFWRIRVVDTVSDVDYNDGEPALKFWASKIKVINESGSRVFIPSATDPELRGEGLISAIIASIKSGAGQVDPAEKMSDSLRIRLERQRRNKAKRASRLAAKNAV